MSRLKSEVMQGNFDHRRKYYLPEGSELDLRRRKSDKTYETFATLVDGWKVTDKRDNAKEGESRLLLKILETARLDDDSTVTESQIMTELKRVAIGGLQYDCYNPVKPQFEARYYQVELEWLGDDE